MLLIDKSNAVDEAKRIERLQQIRTGLADKFHSRELAWNIIGVSGNRCRVVPYVPESVIVERLNNLVGVDGWQETYESHLDGMLCTLTIRIGEWITHVGSATVSDSAQQKLLSVKAEAFRRAALRFSVGVYLAKVPPLDAGYDPETKVIASKPKIPPAFVPDDERPLNDHELNVLQTRLQQSKVPLDKFKAAFNVASLNDLTLEQYKPALDRLDRAIQTQSKG